MSKHTDVVKQEENLPAVIDFTADAGMGMEQADKESFAIPFLSVIQKTSPQCDEASGQYNPNAKPGMLLNTVTGQLFDGKEGLVFLPVHYQRRFLHWGPRDSGGFKGEFKPEDVAAMQNDNKIVEQDGRLYFPLDDGSVNDKKCDRLADTRNHFGILEQSGGHVLLSLTSTQIKKSKMLMSMLSQVKVPSPHGAVTPATWANRVKITTVLESNDKGSWYGVKFELAGMTKSRDAYNAGKDFYQSLQKGTAGEVRYAEAEVHPAEGGDKF